MRAARLVALGVGKKMRRGHVLRGAKQKEEEGY